MQESPWLLHFYKYRYKYRFCFGLGWPGFFFFFPYFFFLAHLKKEEKKTPRIQHWFAGSFPAHAFWYFSVVFTWNLSKILCHRSVFPHPSFYAFNMPLLLFRILETFGTENRQKQSGCSEEVRTSEYFILFQKKNTKKNPRSTAPHPTP